VKWIAHGAPREASWSITTLMRLRTGPRLSASVLCSAWLVAGTGCSRPPAPGWVDFFTVQAPVVISSELARQLNNRPAFSDSRGSWISVDFLRTGLPGRAPASAPGGPRSAFLTSSGGHLADATAPLRFASLDPPYWTSIFRRVAATGGGRTFVALNLVYPIYVHDLAGVLLDSLASPPPSWRQARAPAAGEFLDRDLDWREYLRSFTVIAALAVIQDSVLVVSHGRYLGDVTTPYRIKSSAVDIYAGGRKIAGDLPSPGELVAYTITSLFFLRERAPGSDSELVEYRWRR